MLGISRQIDISSIINQQSKFSWGKAGVDKPSLLISMLRGQIMNYEL